MYDLSYLYYPEMFQSKRSPSVGPHWTRYSARLAKHILTISHFSKRAIMEKYEVPDERITVVYPGLTMSEISNKQISNSKKLYPVCGDAATAEELRAAYR